MKSNEVFLMICGVVLVSLVFFLSTNIRAAQTQSTASNVTVQEYVAIGLSNNFTAGIMFGTLNATTTDNNATGNYNTTLNSSYYINISSDSNVNVDLCIKDNDTLQFSTYDIMNGNYTWSDAITNLYSSPALQSTQGIATTYQKVNSTNIAPGSADYYRFWLDIPAGQASGTYYNTVNFEGVKTGTAC